jgi:hypothetical protein
MSLNSTIEEADTLAHRLANRTGERVTAAATDAWPA